MRLIDADELKKTFVGNKYGTQAIEYYIDNAPTVDAEPVRHGHWEEDMGACWCSCCDECCDFSCAYCPNCGSKMDEEVANGKED